MAQYKPVDDHWQSLRAAIEGRPPAEPVDVCIYCGAGLEVEDGDSDACMPCAVREGLADG